MATWNSRGLRGSTLEELINITNELYREKGLGLVQKIPTPITPVKIDKENGNISLAYFEKDSTVDYIGVIQGVPVCFDAKECAVDKFSLRNIHEHQIEFMRDFEKQDGISFLIVMFTHKNQFYYMRFTELLGYIERVNDGHPKYFKYEELNPDYFIKGESGALVHYLKGLQLDLSDRQKK
ncbi:MAG: Holliday junction resolvase RecU [Lachnospiraceae bacterium]|nr:Holliday junction resolvase RecU [Lachnospiraceae bacterium]